VVFEVPRWELQVFVPGRPAPQGSKGAGVNPKTGKTFVKESSPHVGTWRNAVVATVWPLWRPSPPLDGPLLLVVEFVRPRPSGAPKRSTPAATTQPDLDKLVRSTGDALKTAKVYTDDARIVTTVSHKRNAEIGEHSGAHIRLARWLGGWAQ
jgi:Holliday junction resolvase RusA-like endonuclease